MVQLLITKFICHHPPFYHFDFTTSHSLVILLYSQILYIRTLILEIRPPRISTGFGPPESLSCNGPHVLLSQLFISV